MTAPAPIRTRRNASGSYSSGLTLSCLNRGNTATVVPYTTKLSLPHTWHPINTNASGNIVTLLDAKPQGRRRCYHVITR